MKNYEKRSLKKDLDSRRRSIRSKFVEMILEGGSTVYCTPARVTDSGNHVKNALFHKYLIFYMKLHFFEKQITAVGMSHLLRRPRCTFVSFAALAYIKFVFQFCFIDLWVGEGKKLNKMRGKGE